MTTDEASHPSAAPVNNAPGNALMPPLVDDDEATA